MGNKKILISLLIGIFLIVILGVVLILAGSNRPVPLSNQVPSTRQTGQTNQTNSKNQPNSLPMSADTSKPVNPINANSNPNDNLPMNAGSANEKRPLPMGAGPANDNGPATGSGPSSNKGPFGE